MSNGLLVENTEPGVFAIINAGQVARPIQQQPTSTFFVVGYSPWGPVGAPRVLTSWTDYVRQFGGFDDNSFTDKAAYIFFNFFPGQTMWMSRAVGATPVKGTLTLQDQGVGANQKPTLSVTAKYPSTRADISVAIAAGTNANTFKLTIASVFLNRTEAFDNLIVDQPSLDLVNQRSLIVNLANLLSANAAPINLPAILAATPLAGGTDDFAHINDSSFVGTDDGLGNRTGLQCFNDASFGDGQVAIPGITTPAVRAALIAHGNQYYRLALIDPPFGSSKQDLLTIRQGIGSWEAAMYWPWVQMLDFSKNTGVTRFYAPSAFAAGACALVDRTIGPHKAPANVQIPNALGVELAPSGQTQTDDNTRAFLNGNSINVICPLPEQGVKIYGARVMQGADPRVQMVHQARLLNLFYYSAIAGYQWAPFSVVDPQGRLFRDLIATGNAFLINFWRAGALFSDTPGKPAGAFVVIADSSNNPPEELENQRVHVQWGVHLSPTAEMIIINIDNVPLFQPLSVLSQ